MSLAVAPPGTSPPHQPFCQFNDFRSVGRANRPLADSSMWALESRRRKCSPRNVNCSCCPAPSGTPAVEFLFRDTRYRSKMALIDGAWIVRPEFKDPNNSLLNSHSQSCEPVRRTPKPQKQRPQSLRREGQGFARFDRLRENRRISSDPWVEPAESLRKEPRPFTLPELKQLFSVEYEKSQAFYRPYRPLAHTGAR